MASVGVDPTTFVSSFYSMCILLTSHRSFANMNKKSPRNKKDSYRTDLSPETFDHSADLIHLHKQKMKLLQNA